MDRLLHLCLVAFFLSTIRRRRGARFLELALNGLLIVGIGLDIYAGLLAHNGYIWAFIILPLANQFLLVLGENRRLLVNS